MADSAGGIDRIVRQVIIVVDSRVGSCDDVVVLLCAGGISGLVVVVISIENSRVVGNTAATLGGGICVETDSTLGVTSTTVADNRATAGNGGM
jgi:predicted outer membrane repeat protein